MVRRVVGVVVAALGHASGQVDLGLKSESSAGARLR